MVTIQEKMWQYRTIIARSVDTCSDIYRSPFFFKNTQVHPVTFLLTHALIQVSQSNRSVTGRLVMIVTIG